MFPWKFIVEQNGNNSTGSARQVLRQKFTFHGFLRSEAKPVALAAISHFRDEFDVFDRRGVE